MVLSWAYPRYYHRNYLNSLAAKLGVEAVDALQDRKLDELHEADRHAKLRAVYDEKLNNGEISEDYLFEDFLSDLYKVDFVKQIKINSK